MKKIFKTIIPSTLVGFFLYAYLFFSETGQLPLKSNHFPDIVFIIGVSNLLGFSIYYFNQFLFTIRYIKKRSFARILSGIILNYILILVVCSLCFRFYAFAYTKGLYSDFYEDHFSSVLRFYILSLVAVFLFVLIDFLIRSYQQFENAKVKAVQLAREQSELQLDAFKMQLSPHFLFNNLNTLSHLIYQNPETSEKYIRNLSKTYDYILKNSKLDLVQLEEELTFIKAYSYLLNIRFQDSLKISIDVDESKNTQLIPPLSLQLLVENAVKHNALSPKAELNIEVRLVNNYIQVKNNLLKTPVNLKSNKLGLKNLKRRYSFFTQELINIAENEYFTVRIPLIKSYGK